MATNGDQPESIPFSERRDAVYGSNNSSSALGYFAIVLYAYVSSSALSEIVAEGPPLKYLFKIACSFSLWGAIKIFKYSGCHN